MARNGWHILREGNGVTVTRRLPLRWDVAVRAALPNAGRLRVAQQIRQDLWRELSGQRGFAPAVEVVRAGEELLVRAGGRVAAGHAPRVLETRIAGLLADRQARARWVRCARPSSEARRDRRTAR